MKRDKDDLPSNYYGSPEHPINLPEVIVTAKKPKLWYDRVSKWFNDEVLLNPGNIRVKNYRRAEARNPNFSRDWDMASNIAEGVNVMSGGFLNRLSPTLNIGLIIDAALGDNVMQSWFGNSGIVSDKFVLEHPYWAMGINLAGDVGTYTLLTPSVRALNTRVVRPYRLSKVMNLSLSEPPSISSKPYMGLDEFKFPSSDNIVTHADKVYGLESLRYRDPTRFLQGVRTSGFHKTTRQGSITGSRNVDDPNLPGPIDYHPSRVVSDILRSPEEILLLRNYLSMKILPRGEYMPDGILFNRVADYTEGFRPSIVRRWTNPENGRIVFDWTSNHNWPIESPSGRWLPNKDSSWMWTDLLKVPITLFHKKGGKLNEKD